MNLLDVQCPYCGSQPGEECVTNSGKAAKQPHAARRTALEVAIARKAFLKHRKARKAKVARGKIVRVLSRALDMLASTGSEWNTTSVQRWVVKRVGRVCQPGVFVRMN